VPAQRKNQPPKRPIPNALGAKKKEVQRPGDGGKVRMRLVKIVKRRMETATVAKRRSRKRRGCRSKPRDPHCIMGGSFCANRLKTLVRAQQGPRDWGGAIKRGGEEKGTRSLQLSQDEGGDRRGEP